MAGALVLAGCAGAPTRTAAGGSTSAPAPALPTPPVTSAAMYKGADISALARIEQAGGVFRDSGRAGDAIAILAAHGSNTFRLRLFVNPSGQNVQVNDLPYTLALARRIKAAGAHLLLDFHYSDTWADPGHQTMPAAWVGLGFDSLEATVQHYSADVIAQLKAQGTLPGIVQIGNEIDGGMLWPIGKVGGAYDTPQQWSQFTRLLKAGVRGVRSALAPGDRVRIMIQYSGGGKTAATQRFFDHIDADSVPYDLIGLSYYPWWQGGVAALQANLDATAQRHHRGVMVVETSYPWRAGGWEGMGSDPNAMTWPATPAGQAAFLADVIRAEAAVPDGLGAGVIWWYPEAINVPGLSIWGGGSLSLFDASGNLLPAAGMFASP